MKQPPTLATALVRRFTKPDEGVLGDLVEQFQSDQSRLWYWRQVIGVIAQALVRDVQDSWPFVVGVIVCGLFLTIFAPLVTAAIQTIDEQLFMRGFEWFYVNGYRLPSMVLDHPWSITATVYTLIGWIVGRVAGRRHAAVVLAFAASVFAGGIVAPLTQFGVDYPMLSFHFRFAFHPVPFGRILTQHFMVNGHADFMNIVLFNVVILPLLTLIGGLSAGRRDSNQSEVMA